MAEGLGAVGAVIQLLEAAISIFKNINKAYKGAKKLPGLLHKYEIELGEIRDLAARVHNEESLKEADVFKQLSKLKEHADQLFKLLEKLDPGDKNALRKFADQLVRGQSDKKRLDEIMKNLDHAKDDLDRGIAIHHLRITRKIQSAVEAKPKRRSTTGGTTVSLRTRARTTTSSSDISSSSSGSDDNDTPTESSSSDSEREDPSPSKARSAKIRIVEKNKVANGGFQSNANCGDKDLWAEEHVVKVRKNKCIGGFQNNYSNKKEDLERLHDFQIVKQKEQNLYQREQIVWLKDCGFSPKEIIEILTRKWS